MENSEAVGKPFLLPKAKEVVTASHNAVGRIGRERENINDTKPFTGEAATDNGSNGNAHIAKFYDNPDYRKSLSKHKDSEYTKLFDSLCEDIKSGKLSVTKLRVIIAVTKALANITKSRAGLLGFPSHEATTDKAQSKNITKIIRLELEVEHLRKTIEVYNAVIKLNQEGTNKTDKQKKGKRTVRFLVPPRSLGINRSSRQ